LLIEVIRKVRSSVGPDYPILMKMNSRDYLEGGLSLEDALTAGGLLEKEGLDALEISGRPFACRTTSVLSRLWPEKVFIVW
jgi:2,4-dienoyl-CoA reductase-like NADH-dependent reductase (Old Yellow Enzyme family)